MSSADVITLPKLLSKVPEIFGNLPGLIKGSKMSKITDTNTPLGLGVAFEKATDSNPNGVAILYEDRELTYKQFNAWANRIADYLASIGLKKGDTVAVDVENRPELLATVLGCRPRRLPVSRSWISPACGSLVFAPPTRLESC